ncbi:MAG: glycosyltransferase [Phycisphaerales bacterium JB061]
MNVSVLIPSRNRADKLAACLRALSDQDWQDGDEVVVGLDGPDEHAASLAQTAFRAECCKLRIYQEPHQGQLALRHHLLKELRGQILVSLNDDVIPAPGFIQTHRRAVRDRGNEAVFVGYSPYAAVEQPTVIDRIVRETSWIFFYDKMLAKTDPDHDFGFRHLFGLNFSASLESVRRVGGFTHMPLIYGHEDIELGYRLARQGLAIRFLAEARADHDHRMSAESLLIRETKLGEASVHFARANPDFAREVFRDDIISEHSLTECAARVRADRDSALELTDEFLRLGDMPGDRVQDIGAVFERFRPLKKHYWRQGLIETAIREGLLSTLAA